MTKVIMKAADTLHITAVQADSIRPGNRFAVDAQVADSLEKRGLTTRVTTAAKKTAKSK